MPTQLLLLIVAALLQPVACAPEMVFGEEGKSITLAINGSDVVDIVLHVTWLFNETDTYIVNYYPTYPEDRQLRVQSSYKSRVEFSTRYLSMELKNLTKKDSGLYIGEMKFDNNKTDGGFYTVGMNMNNTKNDSVLNTGEMTTSEDQHVIVEYYVVISEPVAKPVLITHLNWSSGDECQVMVTCRAGDLSVTSSCNISTCTQDGDSTHGGLSIFTRHGSIICNHSNPVSWRQDTVDIGDLCPPEQVSDPLMGTVPVFTAVGVTILLLLLSLLGGTLGYVSYLKKKGGHVKHLYQEVSISSPSSSDEKMRPPIEPLYSSPLDTLPQNPVVRSPGDPLAIYSKIQPHTGTDPDLSQADHVYSSVV